MAMITNLLFLNLFLHIIYFSWMKVEHHLYIYRLALISLTLSFISSLYDTLRFSDGFAITLFNDSLRINQAVLAQESFLIFLALLLLIAFKDFKFKPEFFLLIFINLISASFLLESYNFIIFFISWELFNLSLYIIIIGNGVRKQEALAASLKYFLLSAFSTALLLLGLAILYHITGSLEFESIFLALNFSSIDFPVILIIFALLFKLGAAPLHFWAPDLYDATPLPVTAYISNLPKLLYLFLALNLVDFLYCQNNFFIIAGFLSLIFGTFGLTQQFKIKRFLAFSAITNLGYFLLIIQYPGLLLYNIILYILPVINIFIILISAYNNNHNLDNFSQLKGFFHTNPLMSLAFAISIFSIAGIPPLPGFFAKYYLLSTSFEVFHPILFSIIIITTVIAVANYLRILFIILYSFNFHNLYKFDHHLNSYLILFITLFITMISFYSDFISVALYSLGYV